MGDNHNTKDIALAIHSGKISNQDTEQLSKEIQEMANASGVEDSQIRNVTMAMQRAD